MNTNRENFQMSDCLPKVPSHATLRQLNRAMDRFFERRGIATNNWGRRPFRVGKPDRNAEGEE